MPILLDDLDMSAATLAKAADPKFFSGKLTGSGKKVGLLNQDVHPVDPTRSRTAFIGAVIPNIDLRQSSKQHDVEVTQVPLAPITRRSAEELRSSFTVAVPHVDERFTVTLTGPGAATWDVVFDLTPQALTLYEDRSVKNSANGQPANQRDLVIQYRMELFVLLKGQTPAPERAVSVSPSTGPGNHDAAVILRFDTSPVHTAADFIADVLVNSGLTATNLDTELPQWLADYPVYERIARLAQLWDSPQLADEVCRYIQEVPASPSQEQLNMLAIQLRYLENYNVALSVYSQIHQQLRASFTAPISTTLAKQNMSLLMNHTLDQLEQLKPQLITAPQPVTAPISLDPRLSPQQFAAVTTHDPLVMVQAGAGTGKAQPLDEPVLTPHGWATMGALQVGDEVMGSDGTPTRVAAIHERGTLPGYKLTFRDGSSTRACGEHIWTILNQSRTGIQSREKTTQQWIDSPSRGTYFLPMVDPIQFAEQDLPIDPYLLGALIADGSLHRSSIKYAKAEQSVIDAVHEAALHDGFVMYEKTYESSTTRYWLFKHADNSMHRSEIKERIKALGLTVASTEKFVPAQYLTASIEQRLRLINGLFDGDGRVRTGRGYAQYSTTSAQLADDVLHLLRSLGLSATKQLNKHKKGDYWLINLLADFDPFYASKHRGRVEGAVRPMRRTLVSAEPIDPVPMRCIVVDAADSLYVTKDFIITHNSSTILQRIAYLQACGVPIEDVTVLSFTNAAADNITERNPGVGSMTIAAKIIDIYTLNHPTHKTSAVETVINSLDIFYPNDALAAEFRRRLLAVEQKKVGAVTGLNTFVENHFDQVIALLDRIQQTTLEMQIIICYQRIDQMTEPAHVRSKHLIIDEVQDNSVFEFIYLLKYVAKHRQSLYIVGDASQTLYEFRSANPKALNALESSGIFTCLQLSTNYRSNQEILDFANVTLAGLETNQFAQIKLQANSLAVPTADSFQEAVTVEYHYTSKIKEFVSRDLGLIVRNTVVSAYVQPWVDAGEQVAFLAHSRREVTAIQQVLEQVFPDQHVASLVSDRPYASDILSKYIKNFWNDVLQVPPVNAAFVISQGIRDHMDKLTTGTANPNVSKAILAMVSEWWVENSTLINAWVTLCHQGALAHQEFFDRLRDNLLSFEIRRNQSKLNVVKQRNSERKQKNLEEKSALVVSTIHGAKGLEFDHVVVVYKDSPDLTEDVRRMFYVAFTRAMKTEYVLAYGNQRNPLMQAHYDQIVAALTLRDKRTALLAQGVDPDQIDDVLAALEAGDSDAPVPAVA